jgi:hypothetical protein
MVDAPLSTGTHRDRLAAHGNCVVHAGREQLIRRNALTREGVPGDVQFARSMVAVMIWECINRINESSKTGNSF